MIRVPVVLDRAFRFDVGVDAAFDLLSDVPAWGRLFPRVTSLDPVPEHGPHAWRWTMDPLGPPGFEAVTVYGCRYVVEAERHSVVWAPIESVGNARFEGEVALKPEGEGTAGSLHLAADLELPAPRFARAVVQPAVAFEMGRMTDAFLRRVRDELEA